MRIKLDIKKEEEDDYWNNKFIRLPKQITIDLLIKPKYSTKPTQTI